MRRVLTQNFSHIATVATIVCALCFTMPAIQASAEATAKLQDLSQAFRDIAKEVGPAVVFIGTEQTVKSSSNSPTPEQFREFFGDDFMRRFFGEMPQGREYKQEGLGSGFITSADGYILTNNHVVENADKITVTLADKREFKAEVVGTDPKSDVAVIKIQADNLPVAKLGDSETLEVGDWVIAIGTPFGLSQTVTAGIISAEGRSNIGINDYEDFIQTDAAINPGNSGGPLVNINGEVIGINTAIFSRSGGYQGIGFAIPINMAKSVQESLIKNGKVIRGWLGVMIQQVTPEMVKQFDLPEGTTGTLVGDVLKGGPAQEYGIQRGDVIVEFDGKPIDSPTTLKNIVAVTEIGKKVDVVLYRNGKKQTIQVKIAEQTGNEKQASKRGTPDEATIEKFGLSVQELTKDIAGQLGYDNEKGVVISNVEQGSPAAEAGLRRGDLIQEINKTTIESLDDYNKAMKAVGDEKSFLTLIRRGENTSYVVVSAE
ncbi:protease Do [Candidatus Moduliflexus flocculans]|uniref:Probable periplasmic serine endoprotease DegP-like n=1 Tax=Candidatus Moduliflexus flocculans TaxID=1499966 RepID=A0A0S6VQ48_9BACT|nr:protease Do [Candidatus Moduliflexus flocculans]